MADVDLYGTINDAVIAEIKALALDGIGDKVLSELADNPTREALPCAVVTVNYDPQDDQEEIKPKMLGGDTRSRDWKFPLWIFFKSRNPATDAVFKKQLFRWSKAVSDRFHHNGLKLPTVPSVYNTEVVPDVMYDAKWENFQNVRGGLLLLVTATEVG